jgi:hypothetical protein
MPSTRNLQASTAWASPMLDYQPVTIGGNDPALTAANLTKQIILGAPFRWPWNRAETTVTLIVGQQDYPLAVSDVGMIEKVVLYNPSPVGSTMKTTPISIVDVLTQDQSSQRPASGVLLTESATGVQTFRFNVTPDLAYVATIVYQRRPVLMTSLAATWAPIPDALAYIYDFGYLAHLSILTRDGRMSAFRQSFTSHLLGVQDGITATERNVFLGNWLDVQGAGQRAAMSEQMGTQARSI